MKVKKLRRTGALPRKEHDGDLGYDLYCSETIQIPPGYTVLVPTAIAIQFPEGYGGFIKDRSSVASKKKLFTVAGVIDNGYIGEIKIAIHNSNNYVETVLAGDKIAQLVLIPTVNFDIEEVDELTPSDYRGTGGFGSTGN